MSIEEIYNAGLIRKYCNEEEINMIEKKVLGHLSTEEKQLKLGIILPNITHTERIIFLRKLQPIASNEEFHFTTTLLKLLLAKKDWQRLNHVFDFENKINTAA